MHLSCFSSTSFKFLWGNCNKSLATKLQKLQKHTARILTSSSYDDNVDDLFVRLGSGKNLIFDENSKKKTILLLNYLKLMFIGRSEISNYSLRDSKGKLAVPLPSTNSPKQTSAIMKRCRLPANLGQTHTLASFKSGCSLMMNWAHEFEKTKGAQKQEPPASISKFSMVLSKTQEFSRLSH